jgi:hypothetical protein
LYYTHRYLNGKYRLEISDITWSVLQHFVKLQGLTIIAYILNNKFEGRFYKQITRIVVTDNRMYGCYQDTELIESEGMLHINKKAIDLNPLFIVTYSNLTV